MSGRGNHYPCPGGCGELADECMTLGCGSPLGAFTISPPIGSSVPVCQCGRKPGEGHYLGCPTLRPTP